VTGLVHGRLVFAARIFFIAAAAQAGVAPLCSGAANMVHMQSIKIHIFNGLILFSLVSDIFFCQRYIQTGVLR
jgi:hypothetical protein